MCFFVITGTREERTCCRPATTYATTSYLTTTLTSNGNGNGVTCGLDESIAGLPSEGVLGVAEVQHVQQLGTALRTYRDAVTTQRGNMAAIVQARKEMTNQNKEIVKIREKPYQLQLNRRDTEGTHAHTLQTPGDLLTQVLGGIAALIITHQITRPLHDTMAVVDRIAAGDLSQTIQVSHRDELSLLQQSLRELIGGIRDGVTQIASAAEELSAVTEQTSAGSNTQKVETGQIATAMREMSASVKEVARNAEHAASAADHQAQVSSVMLGSRELTANSVPSAARPANPSARSPAPSPTSRR